MLLLVVAGCVTGPPPDWSEAREWRFPIVDPFDEDAVATIGYIDGHGPYVWFFDTGATYTTVDALVMQELNLHALAAGRVQEAGGHTDRIGVISDGQVKQWRIGSLQVRDPTFVVTRSHGTTYHGYRVAGVFGLASIRYLTIDIDRDAGWVRLALPGVIHPPEGQPASVYSSGGEIRLDVKFGNEDKEFVLDTGASVSTIFMDVARDLKLRVDQSYSGTFQALRSVITAHGAFVAPRVSIGGAELHTVRFIEQPGEREQGMAAGLLGQNFLSRFHFYLDLDAGKLVLGPRRAVGHNAWLGRFEEVSCEGMTLDQCYEGGKLELDPESDETEPAFKFELTLRGSPQHAVEVELEMLDEKGLPIYAPFRFGVLLPAGEKPFSSPVEMALKGNLTRLNAAMQAIRRARSVRVRDLRSYPIAVQKAATWVE